jgi:phosphatidylserine decarboxylase
MHRHYTSLISYYFGRFAGYHFPALIQHAINLCYVKLMGVDMSRFRDPCTYKSLNALFTRPLEVEVPMPRAKSKVISGVDALITDTGEIQEGKAYQIKGMSYDIDALFGTFNEGVSKKVEGGVFVNFYLSPKDYHRYHIPFDLKILSATHIPGKLYPVNFPLLRNKKDLFIENERVVLNCEDGKGRTHVLVLVGALNVGKMVLTFEPRIKTNSDIREPQHYTYEDLYLKRGELFGWFEMGSTIVTFSQKDSFVPEVAINQKVMFGEVIGRLK